MESLTHNISQKLRYLLPILVAVVEINRFHDSIYVSRTWIVYVELQLILPINQKERIWLGKDRYRRTLPLLIGPPRFSNMMAFPPRNLFAC